MPDDDWLDSARETFERAAQEIKQTAEELLDEDTRAARLDELGRTTRELQRRVTARGRASLDAMRERARSLGDDTREELTALIEDWKRSRNETPDEFGERLLAAIDEEFVIDREWAHEQATRVAARLNAARAPAPALVPVVIWTDRYNAWAVPGRYVYLSREMQQTLAHDEAVAFVLAHEMAHHDLGHLGGPVTPARETSDDGLLARISSAPSVAALVVLTQLTWMRPELELEADTRAIELCEAAGYDRARCLEAFDAMKKHQLDLRDIEGAYGLDAHPDEDPDRAWRREQMRQRFGGYPSTWERKQRLVLGIRPDQTEVPEPEPEPEPEPVGSKRRRIPDPPEYL